MCRVEEIRDQDIGTKAGLFEVLKIGDEFYSFIVDCKDPKACTILLRGPSKDVLNEVRPSPAIPNTPLSHGLFIFPQLNFPVQQGQVVVSHQWSVPLWSAMLFCGQPPCFSWKSLQLG